MLGIDITTISRFNDANDNVIKAILHPHEIEKLGQSANKSLFLATRWTIKEALFKANNKFNHFNKIHIKEANNQYQYPGYKISTSKEGNYYVAVVIKI